MSIMNTITSGTRRRPRRIFLYGTSGIGKSTWASRAPKPVFVPIEDGLAGIHCDMFPLATRYGDVLESIAGLYLTEHKFQTVVIDSCDWLERLIWSEVCRERGVTNIEEVGYAKGYTYALTRWHEVLTGLDALRLERNMQVIMIAHAKIERFENPETDAYDRYVPRLHKLAAAYIQEWSDEVLFATYKVHTYKIGESFGQEKHRAIGDGERILRTTERPAHVAKNRLSLPPELPLDYSAFDAYVRGEA